VDAIVSLGVPAVARIKASAECPYSADALILATAGTPRLTIASTGAATFSSDVRVTTTGTFGFQDYRTQATQKVLVLNAEGVSGVYAPSLFNIYTKPGTTVNGIASIIIKSKYSTDAESGNLFEFKGDGAAIFASTITCTTLTETSTIRIKENVEDIENPLEIVKKLRGIQYNKIGNNNKEIGVIAEEVYDILPQIVNVDDENQPSSVSYGRLTAILIEAIKKQDEQIEILRKRIEELEK